MIALALFTVVAFTVIDFVETLEAATDRLNEANKSLDK